MILLKSKNNKKINRVVVKLSGSLFKQDIENFDARPYVTLFTNLTSKGIKFVLVAGGGKNARNYITAARRANVDESTLDEMGIYVSRLNAMLMISHFGDICYSSVPTTLSEVAHAFNEKNIVITGGLHPGQSTNATACLIAERIKADLFINATSVEGVFTKDPKKHKESELIDSITADDLARMLYSKSAGAGTYELMDLVALNVIKRSSIPTRIVLCSPNVLKDVFNGVESGTLVLSK